jgi:beta-1,4-mannosyltransferase
VRRRPLVFGEPYLRTAHANPYTSALYDAVKREGVDVEELSYAGVGLRAPEIVHLHWPELTFLAGHRTWRHIARMVLFYASLGIARLRRTRLVWTAHNVRAHEQRASPRVRAMYRRLLTRNVDAVICLTQSGVDAVREEYPELDGVPAHVVPHGHYMAEYDFSASRSEARAALGVDDRLFMVSVGQIRPYKNIPTLFEAASTFADPDLLIGVAGQPANPELRDEVLRGAQALDDSRVELSFLPDSALVTWLVASDAVILPYRAIQNSGSALLALSAGRPVIVPAIGAMPELRDAVGSEWVHTYDGELTADVLARALEWLRSEPRGERPDLSAFDWDVIARQTIDVFRRTLAQRRPIAHTR